MSKRKTKAERAQDALLKLAVGNVRDAVMLLYLSDEEAVQRLPQLNLFNVSEIKRPKGGGLEIKFYDRIKACEQLLERDDTSNAQGVGFYQALEKSVENAGSVFSDHE